MKKHGMYFTNPEGDRYYIKFENDHDKFAFMIESRKNSRSVLLVPFEENILGIQIFLPPIRFEDCLVYRIIKNNKGREVLDLTEKSFKEIFRFAKDGFIDLEEAAKP